MAATTFAQMKGHRADLAGLRGLALLFVLLYHFHIPPFSGGFIGVDVFFVLSGYLISGNTKRSLESSKFLLSIFYMRRITRLAPALLITLVFSTAVSLAVLPVLDVRDAIQSAAAATLGISNVHFYFRSGYFDTSSARKPLLHTWSLGIETQFYMLWAPLHSILHGLDPALPTTFAALFSALGMAFAEQAALHTPNAAFYLPHYRSWEFLIGSLIALQSTPRAMTPSTRLSELLSLIALAALLSAAAMFRAENIFPGVRATVPCISTAVLIATPDTRVSRFILSTKLLQFLGNISYSVYLAHWPLLIHIQALRSWHPLTAVERVAGFMASLACGSALHVCIERPFMMRREYGNIRMFFLKFFGVIFALAAAFFSISVVLDSHSKLSQSKAVADLTKMTGKGSLFGGISPAAAVKLARRATFAPNVTWKRFGKLGNDLTFTPKVPSSLKVVIIGDSHAGKLRPLAVHLRDTWAAEVKIWNLIGCPPLVGIVKIYIREPKMDQECRAFVAAWRERLTIQHFDAVILTARWAMNLAQLDYTGNQTGALLVGPDENREAAMKRGIPYGMKHSRSLFAPALKATAKEIFATGATPILISQPPLLGMHPRACERGTSCAGVSREIALQRLKFVDDTIQNVKGTKAVLLSRYFCDGMTNETNNEDVCRAKMAEVPLYEDENHLSALGTAFITLKWQKDGYSGISWRDKIEKRKPKHPNKG